MESIIHRSYHGPIQAVILDWAGTAVDYGSMAPTAVFMHLLASQRIQITVEDVRSGMGLMKKDHLKTILARERVAEMWTAIHGHPPTDRDVDQLFRSFVTMQLEVLKEYADPIPGLFKVLDDLRAQGIRIGSTTGYIRSMMDVLAPEAKARGYAPDCIICPDEVPAGRPYPWMCFKNAMDLGIFPMQSMIKVGDTLPDIAEGLNAGMWTVGVSLTGNLLGLSETDVRALAPEELEAARLKVASQLYGAGAHYVIDGIWDLPEALEDIQSRVSHGEHPLISD